MILKKEKTSILESIANKKVNEEYDVDVQIEKALLAPEDYPGVAAPDYAGATTGMKNRRILLKKVMKPAIDSAEELVKETHDRDGFEVHEDENLKAMGLAESYLKENFSDSIIDEKSVKVAKREDLHKLIKVANENKLDFNISRCLEEGYRYIFTFSPKSLTEDVEEPLKEDAVTGESLTKENVRKWLTVGWPGATVEVATKKAVNYAEGYEISLEGTEETVDYKVVDDSHIVTDEIVDDVFDIINNKINAIMRKSAEERKNACVGIWGDYDTNKIYVDESEHFLGSEEEAIKLGRERKQLSIWDWKNKESVETGLGSDRTEVEDEEETEVVRFKKAEVAESRARKLKEERDYPVSITLSFHEKDLDLVKRIVKKSGIEELIEIDEVPNDYGICFMTIDTIGLGARELDMIDEFVDYVKSKLTIHETFGPKRVKRQRQEIKEAKKEEKSALYLFEPTEEAEEAWNLITKKEKVEELDSLLKDMYPEGIEEAELNDFLTVNSDWIFRMLGLDNEYRGDDFDEE